MSVITWIIAIALAELIGGVLVGSVCALSGGPDA
jgi:hypothetical protein